ADGRCTAVWTVASADAPRLLALPDTDFLEELSRGFGRRFGRFKAVGPRETYALARARSLQTVAGRVVVLGAAAQILHPNAAQGLNLQLRDVAGLAEVLADAWRLGQDPGRPETLARYLDLRGDDQRRVATFSHGLARLFAWDLPGAGLVRRGLMLGVDCIPPVKR